MARAVHEEAPHVSLGPDEAECAQALRDDARRGGAGGGEGRARDRGGDARVLGGEDEVVDGLLLRREASIHRNRARHVGGVAVDLGAHVHHHDVAVAEGAAVGVVVEDGRVLARADDARVADGLGAGAEEDVLGGGLQVVLAQPGGGDAHRLVVAL